MRNIYETPYQETAEQRLRNQLLNRKKNNIKINNPRLSLDEKRKLQSLNIDDKLHYIRELEASNTVLVT